MSSDDRNSDQDLKAYLDGRDGVSAAYRKTAHEEPPRALDQAILQAARRQHQPSTQVWYASRKPYAVAASLMVAVVAASLYFNAIDAVVGPAVEEQETFIAVNLERAREAQESREEADVAADAAQAEPPQLEQFRTRALAPPVPTVGAADSTAAIAPAAPQGMPAESLARTPEPLNIVIDGPQLEAMEAAADAARARENARQEVAGTQGVRVEGQRRVAAEAEQQANALEEIVITGSRVARRDPNDVSYRESREDWLVQIRLMAIELQRIGRLNVNTFFQERELQEEMDLYMEQYPDADLDAELEALEE